VPNRSSAVLLSLALTFCASPALSQSASPIASYVAPTGTVFRVLLDESNLGSSEVEVGEIIFEAGTESASHSHESLEIFYVVAGTLEHIVNGTSHMLTEGMAGFVRAGDQVVHKVPGDQPVKTLVIWVPGGESAGIRSTWRSLSAP
jgi:quercetin dioxygenase-like cupin family protein